MSVAAVSKMFVKSRKSQIRVQGVAFLRGVSSKNSTQLQAMVVQAGGWSMGSLPTSNAKTVSGAADHAGAAVGGDRDWRSMAAAVGMLDLVPTSRLHAC